MEMYLFDQQLETLKSDSGNGPHKVDSTKSQKSIDVWGVFSFARTSSTSAITSLDIAAQV